MISKHDSIKAVLSFVHSYLIPMFICSDIVLGPSKQASVYATLPDLYVDGRKGNDISEMFACE